MSDHSPQHSVFKFGQWQYSLHLSLLVSGAQSITLTPLQNRLLSAFVNAEQHVLTKEMLIENVWQGRIVSDDAITRAISDLRKILNNGKSDSYIKTLHGVGYQFIKPVDVEIRKRQSMKPGYFVVVGLMVVVCTYFLFQYLNKPSLKTISLEPTVQTVVVAMEHDVVIAENAESYFFQVKQNDKVYVKKYTRDSEDLLFVNDTPIEQMVANRSGSALAFFNRSNLCQLEVFDIKRQQRISLMGCQSAHSKVVSWVDDNSIMYSYIAPKNEHLVIATVTLNEEPILKTVKNPGCQALNAIKVANNNVYFSCEKKTGDLLFQVVENDTISLLAYRSISTFETDGEGNFYLLHRPSWKTGFTHYFQPKNEFTFVDIGYVNAVRLIDTQLVFRRDTTQTNLYKYFLDTKRWQAIETTSISTYAMDLDPINNQLWRIDNREGKAAVYRQKEKLGDVSSLGVFPTNVVDMKVYDQGNKLSLLVRENGKYEERVYAVEPQLVLIQRMYSENTHFNEEVNPTFSKGVEALDAKSPTNAENSTCANRWYLTNALYAKSFVDKNQIFLRLFPSDSGRIYLPNLSSQCELQKVVLNSNDNSLLILTKSHIKKDIVSLRTPL